MTTEVPPPVCDINAVRFYTDAASTIISEELKAQNTVATKPLEDFLRSVSRFADKYMSTGDKKQGLLALRWLRAWGEGNAMLGHMSSAQAEYQRNWMLAGLSMVYLKVLSADTSGETRAVIDQWLQDIAARVLAYFVFDPRHKKNNHFCWSGLGIMATAVATTSPDLWNHAKLIYVQSLQFIETDGSLPLELARQSKALHYHNFALQPLVLIAVIAGTQGEDWFELEEGALHRLVNLVVHGINDPPLFQQLTGFVQDTVPDSRMLGWLLFYLKRYPGRVSCPAFDELLRSNSRTCGTSTKKTENDIIFPRLGGNLTLLSNLWEF